jgi:TetR/AcrR family transcriptional repressor of nem operon
VAKKTIARAPDSDRDGGKPSSQRDATKQETRDALIRAGAELFAKQGLDAPSLDALCARAGFTRGAFYVHFKDREELIAAVMESATASFLEAIMAARGAELDLSGILAAFAEAVSGGTFDALGAVPLHQFLSACARSDKLRRRYVKLIEATRERLAESVRAAQRAGRARGDVDAFHTAGLLVAIGLGVGTILELKVPFDAKAHARALDALLAGG